jgi:hypothetical protein
VSAGSERRLDLATRSESGTAEEVTRDEERSVFLGCPPNGQRSPAAAQNRSDGRLVQRVLGVICDP